MNNDDAINKVKAMLKLHDPKLRKLDADVAKFVYRWKGVSLVNNELGDWIGKTPTGQLAQVPNYTNSKKLCEQIVEYILSPQFSKKLKLRLIDSPTESLDHYRAWEYYSKRKKRFQRISSAEADTPEIAICEASVTLGWFLVRNP